MAKKIKKADKEIRKAEWNTKHEAMVKKLQAELTSNKKYQRGERRKAIEEMEERIAYCEALRRGDNVNIN